MNENEYTTPDGVRLIAADRPDGSDCSGICWFGPRRTVCSRPERRAAGEPMCDGRLREDRRHICWVEPDPNPL